MENWDEIWRRNQFVCAELVRRHPGVRILFVALPRDVSHAVRRGRLGDIGRPATYPAAGVNRVTVTHPPKLLPSTMPFGRRVNQAMFRAHVRRVADRLGFVRPLLWLNPHYAVHAVGRLDECAIIYDITDDWTLLSQSPAATRRTISEDAELCRLADATIVCSQRLFAMKSGVANHLHLIPNGVDAPHYARILDGGADVPAESRTWPKPVLGYTGTLHSDRVDVDLIEYLARNHAGSVALVGPNFLPPADNQRLLACGNVFVTGPVPYARIPNYMTAFDVCITPHKMTPFTESLNPIKLWEYLAAGLPVVSTDVAGFRDYPTLVNLARTPAEFLVATRAALDERTTRSDLRRTEASRHSWQRRVDDVEAVITSSLRRRGDRHVQIRPASGEETAHVA
jgi:glycosyltransferase involved in cell wall biosynthesis